MHKTLPWVLVMVVGLSACGDDDDGGADTVDAGPTPSIDGAVVDIDADVTPGEDLDMQAADFECILNWDKVRKFRITNKLGHLDEAIAVANNTQGGVYPVGTIIQLIPGEAMVKRKAGWNAASGDWEFFAMDVAASGTTITSRGDATVNFLGTACLPCHAPAQQQFDFVCETGHGCDPLPFTPEQIETIQNGDARCP